ncbi:MAG: Rieske 2Fe-2S domain-containing protein [Pseudomonadota bacterium]
MSVKYVPVQWNRNKYWYDAAMLIGVFAFTWVYLRVAPAWIDHTRPVDGAITNARAFGTCAFVMMSMILAIGPLARLDRRFLPLLYNRRHFGVMTLFVALTHVGFILGWYYAFSPIPRLEGLLTANTTFERVSGFPFEAFGVFALVVLMVLAATSHDFWMKFLTPPVWKRLHYLIYPAYAAVVAHVAWGKLQDQQDHTLTVLVVALSLIVAGLHVAAAVQDRRRGDPAAAHAGSGWVRVCSVDEIAEGRARIAMLPTGGRVAVFRHEGALSAISNACAHQNGPLGEGRIVDCVVTCPWHGFQYDVRTGRSPAPFTERVPTYRVALDGRDVLVDPEPNPLGVTTAPVPVPDIEEGGPRPAPTGEASA